MVAIVAVTITVMSVVAVVAVVAVAITAVTALLRYRIAYALLQVGDLHFDVARLVRIEAVARGTVQLVLEPFGLVAQPVRAVVADHVAPVEVADLVLDRVDSRLERADLAEIAITRAIVAIAVAVRLSRIILSAGGSGDSESRACGSKRKNDLTHNGSPSCERLMREDVRRFA